MNKIKNYIPVIAILGIASYLMLSVIARDYASPVALVFLLIGTAPLVWDMIVELWHKKFGVDLIALVAIITSIIVGQYLAGTVVLLMLSGGEALEAYAMRRARRELTRLLSGVPTIVHIKKSDGTVVDSSIEKIGVGDVVIVKPGEVIPVDGNVVSGVSLIDESPITGESVPIEVEVTSQVLSGSINKNGVLEVRAARLSKDSKYQQLIRLVRQAQEHKAPIVRLADRYTVMFTVVTFILALSAWFISGDATRVLAVLVVATPCPLILATPIAMISGISRAARRGIIIKNGGALEALSRVKAFVFDKTGTITLGSPSVVAIKTFGKTSEQRILEIAASLDQLSAHILARSLLKHAKRAHLTLAYPESYQEFFGDGVTGILDKQYFFGKLSFLEEHGVRVTEEQKHDHEVMQHKGTMVVYVADARQVLGAVFFSDTIRPESKRVFARLAGSGVRTLMLTGDRQEVAETIAHQVGITEVYAQYLPEQKMAKIKELQEQGFSPVAMIGDGINDAAALAAADIGIAMGVHGASASSEAGDIVIAVDKLQRVEDSHLIAKRTVSIAIQSIVVGMGLSIGLMFFAASGYISPVAGALFQEVIDVLVILNALRALR